MVSTYHPLMLIATLVAAQCSLHATLVGHSSVGRWVELVSDKRSLRLARMFYQQQFNGSIKRSPTKSKGVANKK